MPRQDFTIFITETGRPVQSGRADTDLVEVPPGMTLVPYRVNLREDWIDPVTLEPTERPPRPTEEVLAEQREAMVLTPRQFLIGLVRRGMLTRAEAVAAARNGTMPDALATFIASKPADEQAEIQIAWARPTEIRRFDPIILLLQEAKGASDAAIDTFFEIAAAL